MLECWCCKQSAKSSRITKVLNQTPDTIQPPRSPCSSSTTHKPPLPLLPPLPLPIAAAAAKSAANSVIFAMGSRFASFRLHPPAAGEQFMVKQNNYSV